jgi:very-short-patch-repair endonuclease
LSDLGLFLRVLKGEGLPEPTLEHRFHPTRKWRFDAAWLDAKVALEIEGAVWVQGRHTRGSGFVRDMEKYNSAAVLGWRVVRVQPRQLLSNATVQMLREILTEQPNTRL